MACHSFKGDNIFRASTLKGSCSDQCSNKAREMSRSVDDLLGGFGDNCPIHNSHSRIWLKG